jgi:hypothetical protein
MIQAFSDDHFPAMHGLAHQREHRAILDLS